MPREVTLDTAREKVIAGIDPGDVDTVEQVNDAFDQLGIVAPGNLRAALQRIRASHDDAAVSPGVHLLNAHTGKGQQFDGSSSPD
jgi:DNA helicase-2/ATP-dependent DNA helicase PcrA